MATPRKRPQNGKARYRRKMPEGIDSRCCTDWNASEFYTRQILHPGEAMLSENYFTLLAVFSAAPAFPSSR